MQKALNEIKIRTESLGLYYGSFHALTDVSCEIPDRAITAIIGPSGCGKSSLLRVFNRMNDLIPGARVEGRVFLDDSSIYEKNADVVSLREKVGMVFQKPNIFPMSIFENVIFGPKNHGVRKKSKLEEIAQKSLSQVALWDEVKDSLKKPGFSLSPGDQQRLCIARALAMEPEVILMDESCSALDPKSTAKIEELMILLAQKYTIITVTHNMEQAVRISDMSAFMMIGDDRVGTMVEFDTTRKVFSSPKHKSTEDYITGRFG